MRFLFIEPFFGGSHRDFAEGLIAHSCHQIDLYTLPARFWKWRMRGAALYFAEKITSPTDYDGLITTNLMSLSDLKMLWGAACPPVLVYFHENQITYPLAAGEHRDFQFGFTDITTALAAQKILFNSHTHMNAFFEALPGFIRTMPEYKPMWVVDAIKAKAEVLYPGCRFYQKRNRITSQSPLAPLVIWNHRWEFDKNPEDFFDALAEVEKLGFDFRIALLGENFQKVPKAFIDAKARFGNKIIQYGYIKSKKEYVSILSQGQIVISTSNNENFGISVIEAIRYGCIPLLPARLAYHEVLPKQFYKDFLYLDQRDLIEKLTFIILNINELQDIQIKISEAMGRFAWESMIKKYDHALERLSYML
ncbi:hypothetical protein BuS5_02495 [Desulfosarcina sp. BuS5]|uniref:tRNA-queuosine alpha-mannosyltransferase domain-containing protein n=1 Tax=Desulfosarcina sp. BuS5 TaxID=933262 RepID=UPI0004869CEA|nr:DUF3524 domain-containing protein [Desulfosarcina sp. BuS5]WDN89527.1 hypothetical protein BuS5_02495 [Desulfosarcina sp. BuS5]